LKARWVFPVEQPPLPGGTITIAGERICAVGSKAGSSTVVDLGDVAILPGLVNAHTHLDLSGLRGKLNPGNDLVFWLREVIRHRRGLSAERVIEDIRSGLAESLACGTTVVGDIASQGLSWSVLSNASCWSVVFYELLGLPRERARQAWQDARAWLSTHPATPVCSPGLSPHAPYSVRSSLFRLATSFARGHELPLSTHLAESTAELDLLADHRGAFVDFLTELGVWDANGLIGGPEQWLRLVTANTNVLLVHGNYLESSASISAGTTVVYCPRTHAAFGHPEHGVRQFLKAGVRVALGTDSLASNPDLSILHEARFLHRRYPEISGAELLRAATLAGAEALGQQQLTGSLVPGKSADLIVVAVDSRDVSEPHQLIWESSAEVRAVMWRGRWSWSEDALKPGRAPILETPASGS
jgi:cytosine/adenosine deaminase-related metal-dependent hydrolase